MSLKMEQIKSKNNVVTCSECNSKELLVASKVKAFASSGLIMFIISSVCIWIPILGWIIAPFTFIINFISFVVSILNIFIEKEYVISCKECGATFKVNKREYNEYVK